MRDCVKVTAAHKGRDVHFRGRLVIGADGVSSVVSRIIGNDMQDGLTAVAVRAYYSGVPKRKSGMKIFFSRSYFPGYGWLFRGDDGTANIGVACLTDRMFRLKRDVRNLFDDFVNVDLAGLLGRATLASRVAGGAARFSRPGKIVSDRVMLAGDAGNMIDPLSGAGIHRAMESAFWASETAVRALDEGVCTADFLRMYERLWKQNRELDWRIGEFLLTVAKNPHTRELSLLALEHVGRLCARERKFREFCAGVFGGFVPQSTGLSPLKLLQVLPRSWDVWESYLEHSLREGREWLQQLFGGSGGMELPMRFVSRPLENISWGLDVATKIVRLADCYLCTRRSSG
jgi:2-polyprenyl-6-methoxyphenol hydroxylase-like FAD-dependent oxidoreductase